MSSSKNVLATSALISAYLTLALVIFLIYALPYLEGEGDLRWGADTLDYIAYYQYAGLDQTLFQLRQNLFGPLVILWLVEGNHLGVFLLNSVFFITAWIVIVRNVEIDRLLLFFFLAINPMLFVSLLGVNKEIVSLLVIALYSAFLARGRLYWLILSLIAAFFVRWQNVFIILLFELFRSPINPLRKRRLAFVILFVVGISILYPSFDAQLGGVTTELVDEQQAKTSFGLLGVANNIQRNYGYFVIVVPKILANWFGNLPRVGNLFLNFHEFDASDIYNTFIIPAHQAAMTFIVLIAVLMRRLTLSNDLVFFAIIYSVVYSLGAFIQYRYYFPVYIVFCIVLSMRSRPWFRPTIPIKA